MNSTYSLCDCSLPLPPGDLRRLIADRAGSLGIDRIGFARAGEVDPAMTASYRSWLDDGCAAGMDYLSRYPDLRRDPRLLLPGARTVISCAASYWHDSDQSPRSPRIARYALGDDYHETLRHLLTDVAAFITDSWGAACRVCVDTAPVHERYWALSSGVGFRGLNGLLIVPGAGSYCFLGEIITTLDLRPTPPLSSATCAACRRCIDACPGAALRGDGTADCRRCLSYLTIEHRGDFPPGFSTGGRLAGCDACQEACPHNRRPRPSRIPAFAPRPALLALTPADILALTPSTYAALLRCSPLKRIKLPALLRNARHL